MDFDNPGDSFDKYFLLGSFRRANGEKGNLRWSGLGGLTFLFDVFF
jgi:hypothetical protein